MVANLEEFRNGTAQKELKAKEFGRLGMEVGPINQYLFAECKKAIAAMGETAERWIYPKSTD